MNEKLVYVGMSADIIHVGHLNIIDIANTYGKVCVGILTDEAVESYKRKPIQDFESRKKIVEHIKGVSFTVSQTTLSYRENILKLKPDYVVHGDDWKFGPQTGTRQEVINTLKEYAGYY